MDRAVRRRTGNGLSLFIALARMVTFCKEGGGMLSELGRGSCGERVRMSVVAVA